MDNVVCLGYTERDSNHSLMRAKERAGLNEKRAKKLIENARTRGITCEKCKWSVDRMYLVNRTDEYVVAIAYNGFCFLFNRQTANCITLYNLPKDFGKKKTHYHLSERKMERREMQMNFA